MWISNKIANGHNENKAVVMEGEITESIGNRVYIQNEEEHRNINIMAPYGIVCVPPVGEEALIVSFGESALCTGVIMPEKEQLEPGELMLSSVGGASIVLKNDGRVLINGNAVQEVRNE